MLRAYEDRDLSAVRELIHQTIDRCYPSVYPSRAVAYFKRFHDDRAIADRARHGCVLVLEDAGVILATGALVGSDISGVFVAPDRQGEGLGGRVMDELERQAMRTGVSLLSLSVSLPARGFYESRDYNLVEERSIDVGDDQRLRYWQATKGVGDGS